MSKIMPFAILGLLFYLCSVAYDRIESGKLVEVQRENESLKTQVETLRAANLKVFKEGERKVAAEKVKKDEVKKVMKVLFPASAEQIETVFNPPPPKEDATVPATDSKAAGGEKKETK